MESKTLENIKAYIRPSTGMMKVELACSAALFVFLLCMAHFVGLRGHPPLPLWESLAAASLALIYACFVPRGWIAYRKTVRDMERKCPTAELQAELSKDFDEAEVAFEGNVRIGRQYVYIARNGAGERRLLPTAQVESFGTRKDTKYGGVSILAKGDADEVVCLNYSKGQLKAFDLDDVLRQARNALRTAKAATRDDASAERTDMSIR